jgi:hypothetical protein
VAGVAADHEHHAAAANDLAVLANSLDAGADFHDQHTGGWLRVQSVSI